MKARKMRDTGLLQFLWRHRDRRFRKDVTFGKEVHRGVGYTAARGNDGGTHWPREFATMFFLFVCFVNIDIFLLVWEQIRVGYRCRFFGLTRSMTPKLTTQQNATVKCIEEGEPFLASEQTPLQCSA